MPSQVRILHLPPCDVSGHRNSPDRRFVGPGLLLWCWSWWWAGGLVVASGVDVEFSEELAGGAVDDSDVEVLDEEHDVGSGVGSSDADVVHSAGDAQGDGAA